jgi:hypothetical protein
LKKPDLNAAAIKRIKKVAVELLERLKVEKLRVDHWREKEATRDAVRVAIQDFLWNEETGLPADFYTDEEAPPPHLWLPERTGLYRNPSNRNEGEFAERWTAGELCFSTSSRWVDQEGPKPSGVITMKPPQSPTAGPPWSSPEPWPRAPGPDSGLPSRGRPGHAL